MTAEPHTYPTCALSSHCRYLSLHWNPSSQGAESLLVLLLLLLASSSATCLLVALARVRRYGCVHSADP